MDGVYEIEERTFPDNRGNLSAIFSNPNIGFKNIYSTVSRYKVIRGLHYTLDNQSRLLRVIWGEIFDVVLDMREQSDTFGEKEIRILKPGTSLFVPYGVAHGYQVTSKSAGAKIEYFFTDVYHPEHERTVLYNDPYLEIPWPIKEKIVSEKDRNGKIFIHSEYIE